MGDVQYQPLGTAAAPSDWVLPTGADIIPKAIFAHFDGSGAAGSYLPTLTILSDAGTTVASIPMDASVAAGSSVEATWAPFLGAKGGGVASTDWGKPSVGVTRAAAQSVNNNTDTVISWDTVNSDPNGMFNAGTPTRLTSVAAGVYVISCEIEWDANATGSRLFGVFKNGVAFTPKQNQNATGGGLTTRMNICTVEYGLAVGDYFEILMRQDSGAARTITGSCSALRIRIGS